MIGRRHLIAGAAATPAALAAPAVRAESAKVLKFIPQSDVTILDPIWTTVTVTRNHAFTVFDTLYGLDETYTPRPQMVAGHTVDADERLWLLTLRDGLAFHDGTPVLARDAVASIRRWGVRDPYGQALMEATDELSAPDDRTIRFRLNRPFPRLPAALAKVAGNICAIMPERLASTDPFKQVTEVVGSGPFRFVPAERIVGARLVYEKNPAYVPAPGQPSFTAGPKRPLLDRIEWTVIADPSTAASAMRAREADWWEVPTVDQIPLLQRSGLDVSVDDPAGMLGILRFNHLQPPFDNPAIRRALLGAIDQTECMTGALGEDRTYWRDRVGIFADPSPLVNDEGIEVMTRPRDPASVKRGLAEAGYRGERVVALLPVDLAVTTQMAQVVYDQLTRAGLNMDIQAMDWGTAAQRRTSKAPPDKGGWNVFVTFLESTNNFSPAGHLGLRGNGALAYPGWPTAPKLESLRQQWFAAADIGAEQQIARAMQRQFWEDVPYIPLGEHFRPGAHLPSLRRAGPGFPLFANVTKA